MKRSLQNTGIITLLFLFFTASVYSAGTVIITKPETQTTVSSPVKICLAVHDLEVEPAKNGVNDRKGHHHLIVNSNLPDDLSKPIGKDIFHVHMGDGSICKALKMAPGKHVIKALFAKGNHVPYNPPITATVFITVK